MVNYEVIELARCQCDLGEGIFSLGEKLYWFDINTRYFYTFSPNRARLSSVELHEQFSAGASTDTNDFLFASETGLWLFDPIAQVLEKYKSVEENMPETRSNDGRADYQGGFWFGTMGKKAESCRGSLYRLYKGEVFRLRTKLSIPNAICFAPDGQSAYFADSAEQVIYSWHLDEEGWPIGEPNIWVDLSDTDISPDGAVIDSLGCMWNAQWDGSRIVRYLPDGEVDRMIYLPVSRPTCPAFWGSTFRHLAITSARDGLSPEKLTEEVSSGNIFSISLEVAGLPNCKVLLGGER